jgi:uncharacterized protein DUF3455
MSENPHKSATEPKGVPESLKVPPDGGPLLLRAYGKGVQIYECPVSDPPTPRPHAILLKGERDEEDLVAIHFAGPTWQALDGSTVVGAKMASAPSPDPDGVPWLRFTAKSHGGNGLLSRVTYIQRLYTDGGNLLRRAAIRQAIRLRYWWSILRSTFRWSCRSRAIASRGTHCLLG